MTLQELFLPPHLTKVPEDGTIGLPWSPLTGLELLGEIDNSQGQTAAAPAASCPQVPGCAAGSRRATTFEVLRFRAGLQGGTAQPVAGRSPRAAIRAAGPRLRARPCGAVVPRAATSTARCLCLTSDRDAQVSPNWPAPLRTGNLAPRPLPRAGGWPSHLDTLCGRAGSVACRGGGARALQSVRPQAKNRLTGESARGRGHGAR